MSERNGALTAAAVAALKTSGHIIPLLRVLLQRRRPSTPWRFDPWSALLGAMAAFFIAALIYRYRASLRARWRAIRARIERWRARLTSSLEDRYRTRVAAVADEQHLLAHLAPLTDLYIPPPLIAPPASPAQLITEQESLTGETVRDQRRLRVLLATRHTLDLGDALRRYSRLAILGPLGAGKTALLDYLTVVYARRQAGDKLGVDEERLPLPLYLPELDFPEAEETRGKAGKGKGGEIRLIAEHIAQRYRGLGARALSGLVRQRLRAGECCLLLDGLDEMTDDARRRAEDWLSELVHNYPGNRFIIVATPASYDRLTDEGFVGFTLGEFATAQITAFASRWREALAAALESGKIDQGKASTSTPWLPRRGGIRPLDLALRAAMGLESDAVPEGRAQLLAWALDRELERLSNDFLAPDQWRVALGSLALTLHREGRHTATREEVEALMRPLFLSQEEAHNAEMDEVGADRRTPGQAAALPGPTEQGPDEKELARQLKQQERRRAAQEREASKRAQKALASLLRDTALLRARDHDHVTFASPALRTYLAACQLAQDTEDSRRDAIAVLTEHVRDPRWQEVLTLYAGMSPVEALILARLQGQDDLFRSDLLAVAEYISVAGPKGCPDRRVRDGILGELAKVMMRSHQPLALRRAAARALVRTGNKGVPLLFHRALGESDAHLRAVAAWGLGEWADKRDDKTVAALIRAVNDPGRLVRAAALHALASIGGEAATDGLVEGLQHEDEFTRRVAAEALSRLGTVGYDLLKEAVQFTDMHIRRAAVYGLGLIDEEWVWPLLDDLRRNDREWFVRSAVEEVLAAKEQAALSDFSPRPLHQIDWLTRWAAGRGLQVSSEAAAKHVLLQALEEGEWPVRLAAADTLCAQGGLWAVDALQRALSDEDDLVREAAFAALKEMSWRSGERISG